MLFQGFPFAMAFLFCPRLTLFRLARSLEREKLPGRGSRKSRRVRTFLGEQSNVCKIVCVEVYIPFVGSQGGGVLPPFQSHIFSRVELPDFSHVTHVIVLLFSSRRTQRR